MSESNKQNEKEKQLDDKKSEAQAMHIVTDLELWAMLFPKQMQIVTASTRKLSKAEAFVDIINRHRLAIATHDDSYLQATSVSLSMAWGWDRTTVKKFLAALEEIGTISIQSIGFHKSIIRLNTILKPR